MKPEEVADEVKAIRRNGLLLLVTAQDAVRCQQKGSLDPAERDNLVSNLDFLNQRISKVTATWPSPNHAVARIDAPGKQDHLDQLTAVWKALFALQLDLAELRQKISVSKVKLS